MNQTNIQNNCQQGLILIWGKRGIIGLSISSAFVMICKWLHFVFMICMISNWPLASYQHLFKLFFNFTVGEWHDVFSTEAVTPSICIICFIGRRKTWSTIFPIRFIFTFVFSTNTEGTTNFVKLKRKYVKTLYTHCLNDMINYNPTIKFTSCMQFQGREYRNKCEPWFLEAFSWIPCFYSLWMF